MTDSDALWSRLRDATSLAPHGPVDSAGSGGDAALRSPGIPPPEPYLLDDDLAAAAEIAIRLRQPLLLTGDPGCGKTCFAIALAHELQLPLVRCQIRSSTTIADLFYSLDDIARFRDAQPGGGGLQATQYYLSFNGLGRAVLFAGGPDARLETVQRRLARPAAETSTAPSKFKDLYPASEFPQQRRVIVLLDEFDKAPRDTPNDMLSEIENMSFEIAELGVRVAAPPELRPITIVTSNSERSLPDPFLRRCIFFDIQFPKDELLRKIVELHMAAFRKAPPTAPLLGEALTAFARVREQGLIRPPGTAELLDWLHSLQAPPLSLKPDQSLIAQLGARKDAIRRTLSTLLKSREDQARRDAILTRSFAGLGVAQP